MDVAASEFYKDGKYDLDFKNPETSEENWLSSDQLLEMYKVGLGLGILFDIPSLT